MSSSSLRPEPAVVEAQLLQSAYNESAAPLAYVILMKSASRLRFEQRCDAAAMRCGCDAMRRCDGDATAMRRRCRDRADGDATAQKPAHCRYLMSTSRYMISIRRYVCRYVQVSGSWPVGIWDLHVGIWWLYEGISEEIPSHTYPVNLRYTHIVTHTFR